MKADNSKYHKLTLDNRGDLTTKTDIHRTEIMCLNTALWQAGKVAILEMNGQEKHIGHCKLHAHMIP